MRKLFFILFFFPLFSAAQITTVARAVAGLATTSAATSYAMTAFTPTANSLLIVFVNVSGSVQSNPTVTGGSLSWALDASALNIGGGGGSSYIFWAQVGGSPASTTITFNCTTDGGTGANISAITVSGQNTSAPIVKSSVNSSPSTSANANYTFTAAVATGSAYIIGYNSNINNTAQATAPSGWTESEELGYSTPNSSMAIAYRNGGETTAGPFTFTNASTTWSSFGIEINGTANTAPTRRVILIN